MVEQQITRKKGTGMIQSLIRDPLVLEIKGFQNSKSAK